MLPSLVPNLVTRRASLPCDDTHDLLASKHVSPEGICDLLAQRLSRDFACTRAGRVFVFVNPYKRASGANTLAQVWAYRCAAHERQHLPPHIFEVAENAFRQMVADNAAQNILLCGEAGSGKTELFKNIVGYFCSRSELSSQERMVYLGCNYILEAFGNSPSNQFDNASRFTKRFDLYIDDVGALRGGSIAHFGLERSFATGQPLSSGGHSVFHMLRGLLTSAPIELRRACRLDTVVSPFQPAQPAVAAAHFARLMDTLDAVGLRQRAQDQLFQMSAVVLHLSALAFRCDSHGRLCVRPDTALCLSTAALLLGIDAAELEKAFCEVGVVCGSEATTASASRTKQEAEILRDTMAQLLYERIFGWLAGCVNTCLSSLAPRAHSGKSLERISIFDGPGLEHRSGHVDSFQQLCCNYVSDRMLHAFTTCTLTGCYDEYVMEDVKFEDVSFMVNEEVCCLIEDDVFYAINACTPSTFLASTITPPPTTSATTTNNTATTTPSPSLALPPASADKPTLFPTPSRAKTSATQFSPAANSPSSPGSVDVGVDAQLEQRLTHLCVPGGRPQLACVKGSGEFVIKHYTCEVQYSIAGLAGANACSTLPLCLSNLLSNSSSTMCLSLFPELASPSSPHKRAAPTVVEKLMSGVSSLLKDVQPQCTHTVLCLRPNDTQDPDRAELPVLLRQVKGYQLEQVLKVQRAGYSYIQPFHVFNRRFKLLAKATWPNRWEGDDVSACREILDSARVLGCDFDEGDVQIGRSKIFIRSSEFVVALERAKTKRTEGYVISLQRFFRSFMIRKTLASLRTQTIALFRGRKDRRYAGESKSFYGDYLGVSRDEEMLSFLRSVEHGAERLLFSEFSMVFLPNGAGAVDGRYVRVVVTSMALYLIEEPLAVGDQPPPPWWQDIVFQNSARKDDEPAPKFALLRRISLRDVKHLHVSPFSDNFLVVNVNEMDPVPVPFEADTLSSKCRLCSCDFTFLNRRHHCRACGLLCCSKCAPSSSAALPDYGCCLPVRCCSRCCRKTSPLIQQDILVQSPHWSELFAVISYAHRLSCAPVLPLTVDVKASARLALPPEAGGAVPTSLSVTVDFECKTDMTRNLECSVKRVDDTVVLTVRANRVGSQEEHVVSDGVPQTEVWNAFLEEEASSRGLGSLMPTSPGVSHEQRGHRSVLLVGLAESAACLSPCRPKASVYHIVSD